MSRRSPLAMLAVVSACGLSACGHEASHTAQLPKAVLEALGPVGAANAGGETPPWSAQVRPGRLHFDGVQGPDLTAPINAFDAKPQIVRWSGKAASGATLALTVEVKPCRDAATGMTYPLTAKAEVGDHAFGGCAARPGNGLGPRSRLDGRGSSRG